MKVISCFKRVRTGWLLSLIACLLIGSSFVFSSAHYEPTVWEKWRNAAKSSYGLRVPLCDTVAQKIIGLSHAEVEKLLGPPSVKGIGLGIAGLTDIDKIWTYHMHSGPGYLGSSFRVFFDKSGQVESCKIITTGGGI